MNMTTGENRDYKYVMQDVSSVYVGAKYTYDELIEGEDIPFKLKPLVNHYIKPELSGEDLSLESHFYYMEPHGFAYQTYLQLKTKVKFSILREKHGKRQYVTETWKLQEFVKMTPQQKEEAGVLIQEIALSKLALMTL